MLAGKSDSTERETYDRARQLKDYKVSVYIRVPTVCSTVICNLLMVNRTQYNNCVQSLDCP